MTNLIKILLLQNLIEHILGDIKHKSDKNVISKYRSDMKAIVNDYSPPEEEYNHILYCSTLPF